jgi:hypothetical protein
MYPVHDTFPCTLPQNAIAEATMPATAKLSGREADRAADWAQAGRSGRSGLRFALSV